MMSPSSHWQQVFHGLLDINLRFDELQLIQRKIERLAGLVVHGEANPDLQATAPLLRGQLPVFAIDLDCRDKQIHLHLDVSTNVESERRLSGKFGHRIEGEEAVL